MKLTNYEINYSFFFVSFVITALYLPQINVFIYFYKCLSIHKPTTASIATRAHHLHVWVLLFNLDLHVYDLIADMT